MKEHLSRLDEILLIPDKLERRRALEQFADERGILSFKKTSRHDLYQEERLVLAIYDGLVSFEKERLKNRAFLIKAGIITCAVIIFLLLIPKKIVSYLRLLASRQEEPRKSYRGFNENGEVLRNKDGQPELFQAMDGYYSQFYNDGRLHFRYLYNEGNLAEEMEYDLNGNLIAHIVYDENGNPHLK